jgi:hypothetical protein
VRRIRRRNFPQRPGRVRGEKVASTVSLRRHGKILYFSALHPLNLFSAEYKRSVFGCIFSCEPTLVLPFGRFFPDLLTEISTMNKLQDLLLESVSFLLLMNVASTPIGICYSCSESSLPISHIPMHRLNNMYLDDSNGPMRLPKAHHICCPFCQASARRILEMT